MSDRFFWLALLEPEIGDIIEIQRTNCFYNDWAIYAGRDKNHFHLIYNMQVYPGKKDTNPKLSVVKTELEKVLHGNLCRVNNLDQHFCSKGKIPMDPNDVIKFATEMIAQDFKYERDKFNAEFYVTQCKYGNGNGFSSQAIDASAFFNSRLKGRPGWRKHLQTQRKMIAKELYGI